MLRLSLRLMRRSARHIAAGGLAVAVATAFMAAALTGAAVMNTTVRDMVAQQFGEASLVVSRGPVEQLNSPPLGSDAIALEVDGVADAFLPISLTALVSADNQRSEWVSVRSWPANSRLAGWPAAQGREGAGAGEATVAWSLAQRLELAPGSRVRLSVELGQPKPDDAAEPVSATTELQVTGVFDDRGPTAYERPAVQTPPETFAQLADPAALAATATVGSLLVVAEPGVATGPGDPLRAALTEALAAAWGDLLGGEACPGGVRAAVRPEQAVLSGDPWCEVVAQDTREAARALTANYLGSADTVLAAGLIFALVSLAVAGLVIANTFQVMVASRTRVLGLLRSLGATRAQLRALVLVEALATGLAASGVGVAGGWALIEGSLLVAGRAYPGIPLPAAAPLPPAVVALCLVAGGAATTAAALAPAALATRVAPVEALHPLAPPSMEIGAGGLRFWWSVMADLGGAALIAAGLLVANSTAEGQAYPVGQLAGAALGAAGSAAVGVGLLVGAVFWVPKVMAAAARPLARAGAAARLAAANLARNPRRTAATATALMIGVTLVSGMIVAAETVNRTLDRQIGLFTAVDVAVGGTWNGWYSEIFPQQAADMVAADALPAKMVARLEAVPGVAAAARVGTSWVAVPSDAGELVYYTVSVADSPVLEAAINLPEVAAALEPGVILVDAWANESIRDPEAWSEGLPSGGVDGTSRQVWAPDAEPADIVFRYVEAMDALPAAMLAAPETIQSLGGQATVSAMWLKVASEADPTEVQNQIMATVAEASTGQAAVQVDNQAVQRAERRRAVDTMLLIGLALLAVSVVVALIGVSNTLSLSVIERRRETAVLRALGLTQGQTRSMLALEGIVMSGVAGLVGVALGTGFAFAAAGLVLGPTNGFALSFPPGRLAWVFGLTLLAGLAASALPGGRAARTAPARALTAL